MPHTLSDAHLVELLTALCGSYDVDLAGGRMRLLSRTLPGGAVCAILPDAGDGVLRLVYDTSKPNAFQHAQAMVLEHWESFREPEVFPDGSVEMIARVCPPMPRGPVPVAVLKVETV